IRGDTRMPTRAPTAVTSRSARSAATAHPAARERRPTWSPMRPDRGFTLLETLLALLIGGLVLTAAYTAVVRAAGAGDGATRRTATTAAARRALLDLTRALETAAARPFSADASSLRIAQTDPEPRLVRWSLDDGRLVEQTTAAFAAPGAGAAAPHVLL